MKTILSFLFKNLLHDLSSHIYIQNQTGEGQIHYESESRSVMSDSLWPHELYRTKLEKSKYIFHFKWLQICNW